MGKLVVVGLVALLSYFVFSGLSCSNKKLVVFPIFVSYDLVGFDILMPQFCRYKKTPVHGYRVSQF
jgi:hypothetical protein